jgi:hypothetical protein
VRRIWVPQVLSSLILLWALNPDNPYGYYSLFRWVCGGVFAYLALQAFDQGKQGWVWVLGITAAICSPITRVHLTREIWSALIVITIAIAVRSIFDIQAPRGEQHPLTTGCSGTSAAAPLNRCTSPI